MVEKNDYGTKMDDVILESLKPQVEEIKQKLASGGSLSQSDIITLTLYAQGNHINHIDMRMYAIEKRMDSLDEKFNAICINFEKFRADIYEKISEFERRVEGKMSGLENKISELKADNSKMTAIIGSICAAGIAIATVITNILR